MCDREMHVTACCLTEFLRQGRLGPSAIYVTLDVNLTSLSACYTNNQNLSI